MENYSVDILNPKAIKLLKDLADLKLIALKRQKKIVKTENALQDILLKAPTWTDAEYDDYLKNHESINKVGNAFT